MPDPVHLPITAAPPPPDAMPVTVLAAMPWQALESPSLPIGLLRSACRAEGVAVPVGYYGGMRWAEFLLDASGGALGPAQYVDVAENGLFHSLGDWVFAGVLNDDPGFGTARLRSYAAARSLALDTVLAMRPFAAEFVDLAAQEILALGPSVVGFSTTFMQNVPSLAVARRLKQLAPDVTIVFGGGNCDGEMGAALHRNFPFVDLVVRGEGEVALPATLRVLGGAGSFADVPGLCWRDTVPGGGTEQRVNPQGALLPPARIPAPDFDDWFARFDASPVAEHVEPKLVVETARGCWWGEAHHCTFCGLNGTAMQFRSKTPERAVAELTDLVTRHEVLDVIVVDNIIDNTYFRSVLPALAERGWDLRIHYEVKSNLRPSEIAALRAARVAHIQPGVESLISPVLKMMDKGVSGTRNVRTLRDCESARLTVSWNWLYGFPGETAAQYAPVLAQLRDLVHLQPPGSAARILLERFSPHFARPELGFARRAPAEAYHHVYALPEPELADLVYLFDTDHRGLSDGEVAELLDIVGWWTDHYPDSSLVRMDLDGAVLLQDARAGRDPGVRVIEEPAFVAAYDELEHGRSLPALGRRLAERGYELTPDRLGEWVEGLAEDGLVFREDDQVVTLATAAVPVKVDTDGAGIGAEASAS